GSVGKGGGAGWVGRGGGAGGVGGATGRLRQRACCCRSTAGGPASIAENAGKTWPSTPAAPEPGAGGRRGTAGRDPRDTKPRRHTPGGGDRAALADPSGSPPGSKIRTTRGAARADTLLFPASSPRWNS